MADFFAKTEELQSSMNQIRTRQQELWKMHEQSKSIVRRNEITAHREQMQSVVNEVNVLAHKVKGEIQALDQANAAAVRRKGQGVGSASERTRTSITAGLKKKLKDLMGEFSGMRARIHDENRQVVQRRVYTVTGQHLPEEDIDAMIETGDSEKIFQKAILEQGRGRVLDTLAEIQERNRAVKDLEASLLELHQVFLDMAVLVEAQGEMLDNIEKQDTDWQVSRAVDYVGGGTKALVEAKTLQKSKRKWCCCAVITLLLIVVIVVVVVVVVYVKPWQYANNNNNNQQPAAPAPAAVPEPQPQQGRRLLQLLQELQDGRSSSSTSWARKLLM
ncbi:s-syntaxin-like protein [Scenedesmus sp. NREL 46B-D3]|nr:s-syntaxin-like protein [Scenedesmus sp. NREL 46B-D3]